jgi:hypothetical protein
MHSQPEQPSNEMTQPTRIVGGRDKSVVRHRVDLASTSHLLFINLRLLSNYGKPE